jgi:two-component system, response regulator PdtaR
MSGPAIKVALADDDANLRKTYVAILTKLGYDVVCAVANGAGLLDHCQEKHVDVALVDLDMPLVDGLAAAEELSRKRIPVILVSGHPEAEHVVLNQEPIVTCLFKPVSIDVLRSTIEQAVGKEN